VPNATKHDRVQIVSVRREEDGVRGRKLGYDRYWEEMEMDREEAEIEEEEK
jgi:hypothetical protein